MENGRIHTKAKFTAIVNEKLVVVPDQLIQERIVRTVASLGPMN